MDLLSNKDQKKDLPAGRQEIKEPSEIGHLEEERIEFKKEGTVERKTEISPQDREAIKEEIRKELEIMEADESLKKEAEDKAKKIEILGEKDKIEHLLAIAKERGVIFAVEVAKKMNDPYVLDIFHDVLAKEGYYQKFMK